MLNTINVNLNTDLKVTRVPELGIEIKSQDINNNLFILRFTDKGTAIELDETYTVEILTKFEKSKSHRLTSATVYRDYARWEFDTSFITMDEKVTNYVYVRKAGSLVVSADANAFAFDVGLSEIDKDAGRVAEVYDENYEKVLADYSGALDERTTERLDEAVADFNQRGDAEIADWRVGADVELEEVLGGRVELTNYIENGDLVSTLEHPSAAYINFLKTGELTRNINYTTGQSIIPAVAGHQYYVQVKFSQGTVRERLYLIYSDNSSSDNNAPIIELSEFSGVITATKTLNANLRLYGSAGDKIKESVMLVDMTDVFGAGNEPSKEWMDRLIEQTGYFDEHILDENWQVGEISRLDDTKADKVQEDWITPTLLNGWEHYRTNTQLKYFKDDFGIVHVQGKVVGGNTATSVFQLPEGYRPRMEINFNAVTNTNAVIPPFGIVSQTGLVLILYSSFATWISINFSFKAV